MPQLSPKVPTRRSADTAETFAAGQAATNLTTRSGKPPFAPQRLFLINNTGAAIVAGVTLVIEEENGSSPTLSPHVPIQGLPIDVPVKTLTTPAGVVTLAYWYECGDPARPASTKAARNP